MIDQEFIEITGMTIPGHPVNRLEDGDLRRDEILYTLSELFYDNPRAFKLLQDHALRWIDEEHSERIFSLVGYLYYISDDYGKAAELFLEAITLSPLNLDNWMDCAFALYHCEEPMGHAILFNYDLFIATYGERGYSACTMDVLDEILKVIHERGEELSQVFHQFLPRDSAPQQN